jgi:GntR family transcriptional regulator, transcriptional repressor for pyruvate dehydrogenase complex
MAKIVHNNIVEQVVEYLGNCIKDGSWKPGEKIDSESELTKKLQVSRSSIRYAIHQFIALGVLESFQGKGTFIKSIPVEELLTKLEMMYENIELKQLLEFRMVVEVEVCRMVAQNIMETSIKELEDCVNKMKEFQNDDDAYINYDIEFHKILLKETKNKLIIKSMESVRDEIKKQHQSRITPADIAIHDHNNIIDKLRKHDGHGAAEAMRNHLNNNIITLETKNGTSK